MGCLMSLPADSDCCLPYGHASPAAGPPTQLNFSRLCLSSAGGAGSGLQEDPSPAELGISHFASSPRDVLGQGGFGYVRRATKLLGRDAGTVYAVKV
jgi:hypothetical protein